MIIHSTLSRSSTLSRPPSKTRLLPSSAFSAKLVMYLSNFDLTDFSVKHFADFWADNLLYKAWDLISIMFCTLFVYLSWRNLGFLLITSSSRIAITAVNQQLYTWIRALRAQEKIVIPVKTNSKAFWCHPVHPVVLLLFLFGLLFLLDSLSLSPICWGVWPWTPSSYLGLCIIVKVQIISNVTI